MTEQTMSVPIPRAPHPDTLADPHLTIADKERGKLICYCPRHRCGAVLHIESGLWAIYSPLSFTEFFNTLGERGIMLPEGEDKATWLQALGMASRPGNATH